MKWTRLGGLLATGLAALLGGSRPAAAQSAAASPHGTLSVPCAACHSPSGWKPARITSQFDHGRSGFPLEGAHASSKCLACHQSLDFGGAPAVCATCHRDVHRGELGATCSRCHSSRSFTDHATMFRAHQQTRFPLEGPHAAVDCQQCHTPAPQGGLTWVNRSTECGSCHLKDYQATTNPDHEDAGFPKNCSQCHTGGSWAGGHFDHSTTAFPLVSAHATARCADCHADGVYRGHAQTCVACHQADYDRVEKPPHKSAGFPVDCTQCHQSGPTEWAGAHFDHGTTRFALTGVHANATCTDCHGDGTWRGKPTDCASCHRSSFDKTTNPAHQAAGFGTNCNDCHNLVQKWTEAAYNHSTTGFGLTGAHQRVTCQQCHGDGVYRGKSTACLSCHQAAYTGATRPSHQGFPTTCTQCHGTAAWTGASFNHSATQFPLTGAHQSVACLACHGDGVYAGKPTTCVSCHRTSYDRTTQPPHATLAFPTDCRSCHTTVGWPGGTYDHSTTQFPLTGAHRAVTCQQCHGDGVYRGKSAACLSCHQADLTGATNPSHQGFPTTCTQCHSTAGWAGANFNHGTTQFPLTGAHLAVSCLSCHGDGVYDGKPTTCVSCHRTSYDRTTQPPHATLAFPTDCRSCHTTVGWPGGTYDHSTTQFPLTGAHRAVTCQQCHGDGVYRGKSTACLSCHQADYTAATNPSHQGFPTTCTQCHSTAGWAGANFDHSTTQFPLTGAHLAVNCLACHGDGVYAGKSTACVSCHRTDYDRTTQPPHVTLAFPTDCRSCHTTVGWPGGTYDHSTTQFPLTGAHRAVTCQQCHGDGVYRGKSTACLSCHQADYTAATNPSHQGFPTTCTQCHTTNTWAGATFDHSVTQFPLTGAHLAATCRDCHADGVYDGKPTACVSCHRADYDRTTLPPHATLAFPTDCRTCHTTTGWPGGTYDHSTTQFPLTGAHRTATCAACHADGVYRGKSTLCASCHQADYDATTDPNHRTARFPTTCNTCHTTTTWAGATFDHDVSWFPIYSGSHRARWNSCSDCHTNNTNYGVFTCLTCHGRTSTDAHHSGVSGYRYDSQACYTCHPRGTH